MSGIRAALERGLSRFYTKKATSFSSCRLAAFGFRNVINLAPTLFATSYSCAFLFPANFGRVFFSSFIGHN